MTAPHDLDRELKAFLTDGPTELPDPSFDAVRDRMESTRQRVVIGPWRMPDMNKFAPIGLGAAAVVVALVVGTQLLGPPPPGGVGAAPTASPTPTTAPSPSPPSPSPSSTPVADLPVGSSYLLINEGGVRGTVTIPAPGWFGDGGGILARDDVDPPAGAGMITFTGDLYVYGDPCAWSTTVPKTPATTVDELVTALAAQADRDATPAVDVTVGGYTGKSITLHVPDDAEFSQCDQGYFGSWGGPAEPTPYRFSQGPGQIDEIWAVDVDGELVVVDGAYFEGTPQPVIDDLRAIVESITFE